MERARVRTGHLTPTLSLAVLMLLLACSRDGATNGAASHEGAPAAENATGRVGLGEIMVQVGRRFEVAGRAAAAHRFDLAEFEVGELEETFEGDVPHAELPREGPTAHIPAMAQAFLKTNLPSLKKAAATRDAKAFDLAFKETAAACNRCHQTSEKAFIEIPSVPGRGVPSLEAEPTAERQTGSSDAGPIVPK